MHAMRDKLLLANLNPRTQNKFLKYRIRQFQKEDFKQDMIRCLPPTNPNNMIICYAVHTPMVPGKFDANKAKSLGVKPGIQFGQLSKGEEVITPEGNVVKPEDVISPNEPGPVLNFIFFI